MLGYPGLSQQAAPLVAARTLAGPIGDMLQWRADRAEVRALGFRPVLPGLALYQISSLYVRDGRLSINLVRAEAQPDRWGAYHEIRADDPRRRER